MLAIYKDLVRKGLKAVEEVPLKFRGEFRELTLEEEREVKKEELKSIRDSREVEIIAYGDKTFDYDDKARERMRIAKDALIDNGIESQEWTCADNSKTWLTVEDFKNINSMAAVRSGALHDKYNDLKEYIDTLETIEEVRAVTFDINVPVASETESEE